MNDALHSSAALIRGTKGGGFVRPMQIPMLVQVNVDQRVAKRRWEPWNGKQRGAVA